MDGDIANLSHLTSFIATNIDIVVDCSSAYDHFASLLATVVEAGKLRLERYAKAGITASMGAPKMGFVSMSGTWVHGSSRTVRASDFDPVGTEFAAQQPPRMVAWRPACERAALERRDVLNVMVVRAGLVYGREGTIWTPLWTPVLRAAQSSSTAPVNLPLDVNSTPGVIHVDDVASGLRLAVENVARLAGTGEYPVFDLVTETVSMQAVMNAAAKVAMWDGEIVLKGAWEDQFGEAMSTSYVVGSGRAKFLLGWEANRRDFVQEMDTYFNAWKVAQEEK